METVAGITKLPAVPAVWKSYDEWKESCKKSDNDRRATWDY